MIKYSIVVPVHNVVDYLEKCILSLEKQSVLDIYEILIVDDGSTDGSSELCDKLALQFANIKVYHKKNGGLASARNEGLNHVHSEYVLFVDSDDYVDEKYIEKIELSTKERIDLIAFNYQKVSEEGELISGYVFKSNLYDISQDEDKNAFIRNMFLRYKIGYEACNKVYSMRLINQYSIRFHEEGNHFPEDKFFNLCYLCHCSNVKVINDKIYYWLQRGTSISGVIRRNHINRLGLNITLCKLLSDYYYRYNKYLYDNMPSLFLAESVNVLHAMQWDDALRDINQYLASATDKAFFDSMMQRIEGNKSYLNCVVEAFDDNERDEVEGLLQFYIDRTDEKYEDYLSIIRPKRSRKQKILSYCSYIKRIGISESLKKIMKRFF